MLRKFKERLNSKGVPHRAHHVGEPAIYCVYYLTYLIEGHVSLIGGLLIGALLICHVAALIDA